LRKLFSKIEFADQAMQHDPGDRVLRGLPKPGHEEEYREVLIELTPKLDVRRLLIANPDQSQMEFEFSDINRNSPLNPALFRFAPPPGTEVIEQ
jgi:outer membrane lipoprotein-sorting protein